MPNPQPVRFSPWFLLALPAAVLVIMMLPPKARGIGFLFAAIIIIGWLVLAGPEVVQQTQGAGRVLVGKGGKP